MTGREIEREEWLPFFDAFSGLHRGWKVTLEVRRDGQPDVMATEVPLSEIHVEPAPSGARISVVLTEDEGEVSHVVLEPVHVWLSDDERGGISTLEIEAANGETTSVRFKQVELPKDVTELAF